MMPLFWFCLFAVFLVLEKEEEETKKQVKGRGAEEETACSEDIPVSVLHVPGGEEVGPECLLNLLKKKNKVKDAKEENDEENVL